MATKENRRNRKPKYGFNIFSSFNKNSRVVNFGTELLTNTNDFITVDSARNSASKTERTIPELLIKDEKDAKHYVLASVRRNNTDCDNVSARFQEHLSRSKSATTNSTQTVNETRDSLSARRSSRQRNPESYSRKINELDHDANVLEDTLDDVGVFRTDGVGGKSVPLSNVKPKHRLSLQESDSFKRMQSNCLPMNKNGFWNNKNLNEKRASTVLCASDVVDTNQAFRNRSKSDPPQLNSLAGLTKHPKQQQRKKPLENTVKTVDIKTTIKPPNNKLINTWSENKVDMVTVATQTEEEYTGKLLYVDEMDSSVDTDPLLENHVNTQKCTNYSARTDTDIQSSHQGGLEDHKTAKDMEEAMKITSQKLTKSQIKGIKAAFDAIDLNHDGKISANELRRACKQLGILLTRDEVEEIMLEADTSGNGTIEYDEFEKVIGQQLVIANYKTKQLREAFGKFDKDGDGFITAEEIRTVFRESGVDLDDEEINELVAEADENGDGVISFEEFVNSVCEKDW